MLLPLKNLGFESLLQQAFRCGTRILKVGFKTLGGKSYDSKSYQLDSFRFDCRSDCKVFNAR
jgi:hypothetical protein